MLVADKVAVRIKDLILKAPAGGIFQNAVVTGINDNPDNIQVAIFNIVIQNVGKFEIKVTQQL